MATFRKTLVASGSGVAMLIIGPVAQKAGVSSEELVALLGQLLFDREIDASMAATGLRNVMFDLKNQ